MPLPEQCDGIDNDCDGTTDEDFLDLDHDGQANCVDPDRDGDGVPEDGDGSGAAGDHPCSTGHVAGCDDNCPWTPNPNQIDSDSDGVGDACEGIDQDGDGIPDDLDNCPADHNPGQEDNEGDGFGDACDPDDDNDGDPDVTDCYPFNELIHHGTEDFPDWLGIDSNCDGIDGEIQKGLFVSPAGGDAGDGSQASPFHSIGVAIGAARLTGARDIYIQHGEYHEMVLLEAAGVGLYGGYDAAWQRIHERPSVVRAAPAPPEATVVVSGSAGASLTRLRIVSEGCTGDAPTVYGVRVTGSTGVRIEDCEVMVGPGCDAGDVEDAADAGTSESGHDGASGKKDGSGGTGGDGGQGCGDGGAGGLGGHGDVPPQAGADAPGGGSGGSAPANGCHTRGADGAPGTPGVNGFQGSGGDGTGGVFGPGFWVGSPGAAGAAGTPGTPGGGGSGGGGTSKCQGCGVCEVFGQCVCQAERGGGGGGGGGGGCGGPEGPGGKAGGGSIGILIHESDVTCLDNTVRTGMGGHGGKGGDGGLLGLGGIGGTGGGGYGGAGDGGTGGTGGWGGEGGGGGGGAGGVSIAIVLWKALTSGPDGLSAQNDLIPGSGGEGGSAGLFGKPSTMAPGLPGKSAEVLDLGAGM
jgi:hypothetical protein